MMPPPPVILLTVLMIGYPLVQILAIRLRRQKRLRFNATVAEHLSDPRLGHFEKYFVRRMAEASRGGFGMIEILLSLPKGMFVSAFPAGGLPVQSGPRDHENGLIETLSDRATELTFSAHPITSMILIPIALGAWCLGACIALLKGTAKPAFPTFHSLIRAVAPSPSTAAFASRDR